MKGSACARGLVTLVVLLSLLGGCSGGGSGGGGNAPGPSTVTTSSSQAITAAGATITLPGKATLGIPPNSSGPATVELAAIDSPLMDSLAAQTGKGLVLLPTTPKVRITTTAAFQNDIRLSIPAPNLQTLVSSTNHLAIVRLNQYANPGSGEYLTELVFIMGEVCPVGEGEAICVTLLPEWFSEPNPAGQRTLQLGIGTTPSNPQTVVSWWERWWKPETAFAQTEVSNWHMWKISNETPSSGIVNIGMFGSSVTVSATINLDQQSKDFPDFAPNSPLAALIVNQLGPFGGRTVTVGTDPHMGLDLYTQSPNSDGEELVYSVLPGDTQLAGPYTKSPIVCDPAQGPGGNILALSLTHPSGAVNMRTKYLHLDSVIPVVGEPVGLGTLEGLSGATGTCSLNKTVGSPHLHFSTDFSFDGYVYNKEGVLLRPLTMEATVDPWPLLKKDLSLYLKAPENYPAFATWYPVFVKFRLIHYGTDDLPIELSSEQMTNSPFSPSHTFDVAQAAGLSVDVLRTGNYAIVMDLCSFRLGGCHRLSRWSLTGIISVLSVSCVIENPTPFPPGGPSGPVVSMKVAGTVTLPSGWDWRINPSLFMEPGFFFIVDPTPRFAITPAFTSTCAPWITSPQSSFPYGVQFYGFCGEFVQLPGVPYVDPGNSTNWSFTARGQVAGTLASIQLWSDFTVWNPTEEVVIPTSVCHSG